MSYLPNYPVTGLVPCIKTRVVPIFTIEDDEGRVYDRSGQLLLVTQKNPDFEEESDSSPSVPPTLSVHTTWNLKLKEMPRFPTFKEAMAWFKTKKLKLAFAKIIEHEAVISLPYKKTYDSTPIEASPANMRRFESTPRQWAQRGVPNITSTGIQRGLRHRQHEMRLLRDSFGRRGREQGELA